MATEVTEWTLVAETKEWVGPITVVADGTPTEDFEVTVTGPGARPVDWHAPLALDGGLGVLVGETTQFPLVVGEKSAVWIRLVNDNPEEPVIKVGSIRVI